MKDNSGQIEEANQEVKNERVEQERKATRSSGQSISIEGSEAKEVIHSSISLKFTFRSTRRTKFLRRIQSVQSLTLIAFECIAVLPPSMMIFLNKCSFLNIKGNSATRHSDCAKRRIWGKCRQVKDD